MNKLTSHLLHVCKQTKEMWSDNYSLELPLTGPLLLFFELTSYPQKKYQCKYMEVLVKIIY